MRVGVDIGGTKVEAARVSDEGEVVARHRVPTPAGASGDRIVERIVECVREVFSGDVSGVGVGTAGFVRDGVVRFCPNIEGLVGVDLRGALAGAFSVPVVVDNDANCFALAEYRFGAGRGAEVLVGVILGTGVGGGVVIGGELLSGVSGSAGEIGHARLLDGSRWEDHLSGPAIGRAYVESGGEGEPHPARIWESGEDAAVSVRERVVRHTGLFFASLINTFNPDVLVVGGGVSSLPFYEEVRAAAQEFCVPGAFEACRIVPHGVSAGAGALGASLLLDQ